VTITTAPKTREKGLNGFALLFLVSFAVYAAILGLGYVLGPFLVPGWQPQTLLGS
jgi:hypothetical protein